MSSKLVSSALKPIVNLHSSKIPKELIKSSQAWFAAAPSGGTQKDFKGKKKNVVKKKRKY